mgnify:CR=1 FL=1
MDAIRKKMQSLKNETDSLFATIKKYDESTVESNARSDQYECDIRDLGKKCQTYECDFDETNDKLTKVQATFEEREKETREQREHQSAESTDHRA